MPECQALQTSTSEWHRSVWSYLFLMSFSCSLHPFQDRHQRSFSTELHHAACRLTFGKLLAMKRCKRRPTRPTTSVSTSALGLSCSSAQVPWLRPHCTWWLAPGRRCIYYSNVDLYSLKTNHQPHTLHYITSLSYCHYIWFSRVFETPVVWQYCEHIILELGGRCGVPLWRLQFSALSPKTYNKWMGLRGTWHLCSQTSTIPSNKWTYRYGENHGKSTICRSFPKGKHTWISIAFCFCLLRETTCPSLSTEGRKVLAPRYLP